MTVVILYLFLAFFVVTLVELAVIIQVGGYLGVGWTIALVVLNSVVGAVLVGREGRRAWDAFRQALVETRWPGDEITQGALILFGGALLLTPGFVTDVVGFLVVIPPTRAIASRLIRRAATPAPVREFLRIRETRAGRRAGADRGTGDPRTSSPRAGGEVLDVEVVRTERDEPARGAGAGGRRESGSPRGAPPGELDAGASGSGRDADAPPGADPDTGSDDDDSPQGDDPDRRP